MNYLEKVRNYITNIFIKSSQTVEKAEVSLMDVYLEKIISVLVWKSKEQTLRTFFTLNTIFWVMLMLNLKFYGILAALALLVFIYDMWSRETLYLEFKGEYLSLVQSIKNVVVRITNVFKNLRRDSPWIFCASMSLFFLMLRIVSLSISGRALSYILFFVAFVLPICYKFLPESIAMNVQTVITNMSTPKWNLAEDELIPFIQGKDFGKGDADLESLLTDHTADSVTNSLVSGMSAMPSYLEVAEAPRDIEEEDLIPRAGSRSVSFTPGELSSDSDSDHREIRFDSDHFNTSSSDEDPYSKNLRFPIDVKDIPRETGGIKSMLSSVITSVSGNLVTNMFQSAMYKKTPVKTTNSESDSDFEMVEPDDISDFNNRN